MLPEISNGENQFKSPRVGSTNRKVSVRRGLGASEKRYKQAKASRNEDFNNSFSHVDRIGGEEISQITHEQMYTAYDLATRLQVQCPDCIRRLA